MVHQRRISIIDFQGGRIGPLQYDLASLLMDPYVALSKNWVTKLYDYYVKQLLSFGDRATSVFRKGFETCALTRNLQVLGAFGHLSRNLGKHQFEAYIPVAVQTLLENLENHHARHRLIGLHKMVQKAAGKLRELTVTGPKL